jgi:hypothetical protein
MIPDPTHQRRNNVMGGDDTKSLDERAVWNTLEHFGPRMEQDGTFRAPRWNIMEHFGPWDGT